MRDFRHPSPGPRSPWPRASIAALLGVALLSLAGPAFAVLDLPLYARLLNDHTRAVPDVAGTRVDYPGLRESADWKKLVSGLKHSRPSTMRREQRLAFWTNVYNILAIELVVQNGPVEGIKDLGSLFFPIWKREVIRIEGQKISLGAIEHDILRPMGDPRIHAALVCASTSCPSLMRVPFDAQNIDEQLSEAMKIFLAAPDKGLRIDRSQKVVTLSRIFDWFEEDFTPEKRILRALISFAPSADRDWLREHERTAKIEYFDYDWALNSIANAPEH